VKYINTIWGVVLVIFTFLLCWLGQVIDATSPKLAVHLGLVAPESELDRTFYLDGRGETIWDALTLWTLLLVGILLLLEHPWWAFFGLIGGGMYMYFAGRGIIVRRIMQREGIKICNPHTLKTVYVGLSIWGVIGLVTIFLALNTQS
jgi:hypothetical protein